MARVLVVAPEGPGTQQLLHWLRQMGHRAQRVALQGLAAVRWSEVEIVICDRDYIQAVEDRYWARWLTNCPQLWLGGSEQSAGQTPQVAGQGAVNARRVVLAAPWTFAELVTALRRLLTLPGDYGPLPATARCRHCTVDLEQRRLCRSDGVCLRLSETEAALLRYLLAHRQRVVSREELLREVWGIQTEGLTTRTVDMHIARLRAKLRPASSLSRSPETIVTVRSQGYQAGPDWHIFPTSDPSPKPNSSPNAQVDCHQH
ncbi:MAG: winged helix-turn-helix domain-containing protein [Gemmataceae bacterium]|nr:winged helix-turn-helix domain-containing protein [Gemmataceae bacterium]